VKVFGWDDVTGGALSHLGAVSLTMGVFDGVHRGHQYLVERVLHTVPDSVRAVLTFRQHPVSVLRPTQFRGNVLSLRQKLEKLDRTGLEVGIVIDFTKEFSMMPGAEFLGQLEDHVRLRYVVVGENFHCGHDMDTVSEEVRHFFAGKGVRVDIATPVVDNEMPVSSTRIREAIRSGRIREAGRMLGEAFALDLRGVKARRKDDRWIVPREAVSQLVPQAGSYAVRLRGNGNKSTSRLTVGAAELAWQDSSNSTIEIIEFVGDTDE